MVEEAFRLNVKWSLQELSRAINGDGKNSPNPLFRVKVVLEGDKVRTGADILLSISAYIPTLSDCINCQFPCCLSFLVQSFHGNFAVL